MAGKWVGADGTATSIGRLAKPHLLNILRMNVRAARSFVRKIISDDGVAWQDYLPRIHMAMVRRAKKLGIAPAEWEDVPESQPDWSGGSDQLIRRRIWGTICFSADDIDAAKQIINEAANALRETTIRSTVCRPGAYAALRLERNPDRTTDESPPPVGRTRPIELPGEVA